MTPTRDEAMDGLLGLLNTMDLANGELDARLAEAVENAQSLLGADGAGLLLVKPAGGYVVVGASNPAAEALERRQAALGDGPGVESTRRRTIVSVSDLQHDPRWPGLAGLVDDGVCSILAAPIWLRGRPAGNLNLMCRKPREWSTADGEALAAYAGVVTAFLRIAADARHEGDVPDQLRTLLEDG